MRPLQSIAMGLVIVGLHASFGGYDALADPVGWLIVILGTAALPEDLVRRRGLFTLALLALVVSIPLWFPDVASALYDIHPSLGWAANLPQVGFCGVLADSLARRAAAGDEPKASAWLRVAVTGFVLAATLPILVFGGGVSSLEVPTYVLASLTLLLLIWLLFSYHSRTWAIPRTLPKGPHAT